MWLVWLVLTILVSTDQIEQAFPQLYGLTSRPQTGLPLSLGGQNFDHCCALAVNDSLKIVNGMLTLQNTTHSIIIDSDLSGLENGQFPCGASFQGGSRGAPGVKISYRYCRERCLGK